MKESYKAIWGKTEDKEKLDIKLAQLKIKGVELISLLSKKTVKELQEFINK